MGSRTRVMKIDQNVRQLAHYFHTPVYEGLISHMVLPFLCRVKKLMFKLLFMIRKKMTQCIL